MGNPPSQTLWWAKKAGDRREKVKNAKEKGKSLAKFNNLILEACENKLFLVCKERDPLKLPKTITPFNSELTRF